MKVLILDKYSVIKYKPKDNLTLNIIRIHDAGEELDILPDGYSNILELSFYDVYPRSYLPSNFNVFSKEDAKKTVGFFKKINKDDPLVIHCHAGVSRSPAIALSLAWYLNDIELESEVMSGRDRKYIPNGHVLKVMAEELNVSHKENVKKLVNRFYIKEEDDL